MSFTKGYAHMSKKILIAVLFVLVVVTIGVIIIFKPFSGTSSKTNGGQSLAAGEGQDVLVPLSEKKQITVYTIDDELEIILGKYAEIHPEFSYKVIPNEVNFFYDLNHSLQNGDGKIDLYCVPSAMSQWYIKGDYARYASSYEDLGIDVDTALIKAGIPQKIIDNGTNPDGELIALPYKSTVSLFMYRRSIAKEVWGTDDPSRIGEIIGAGAGKWDSFLKAAETLKDHGVYIQADYQSLSYFVDIDISHESVELPPEWVEYMDISKSLIDHGYIRNTFPWTEQWFKDLNGKSDKPVFGLVTQDYNLKILNDRLKSTAGDWAVCLPSVTMDVQFQTEDNSRMIMVNRNSPNKDVLGPLIEWITLDSSETGLQYRLANDTFYESENMAAFSGKRTVVSGTVLKKTENFHPLLGGQNLNTVIQDALQAPAKQNHGTGLELFSYWYYRTEEYLRGEIDKETAILEFLQYFENEYREYDGKRNGLLPGGKLYPLVGTRELNLYVYDDEIVNLVEYYIKTHPEFNFKVNRYHAAMIDSYYTLKMIQENLQGDSGDVVDIYCVPDLYSHEMIKGEFSKNACTYKELGIDVDAALKKADIPQYIIDAGTNPDGDIIALPYKANPIVFAYRRSIARKVWGTDDPDEIGKIIGAGTGQWDSLLKAAQALKEHECYIAADITDIAWLVDTGEMFERNQISRNGFSTKVSGSDTEYSINPCWEEFMDISKYMIDNGYVKNVQSWSDEWFSELKGERDKPVFGIFFPYEILQYFLKTDGFLNSDPDEWAICVPPFKMVVPSSTGFLVNRNSPNKDALGPLIEWLTLDCSETGLQYSLLTDTFYGETSDPNQYQFYGGNRPVPSRALLKNIGCSIDFLGGQNISPIIDDILSEPNGIHFEQSGYQSDVFLLWVDATNEYVDGKKDKEAAIAFFKESVEERKESYKRLFREYDIDFMLP